MRREDPYCHNCAAALRRVYVRVQQERIRAWLPVGWWCPVCGMFVNEE